MARILVTGAFGYIGSHTVVDLLEHGHEVIAIDNFCRADRYMPEGVARIAGRHALHVDIDLADRQAVHNICPSMRQVDGIIHFAAYKSVPESVEHPVLYYYNNIQSLVNMLEFAAVNDVRSFLFSSSCSVYGNVDSLPVTEETPLAEAESPYAATKQMGERIVRDFVRAHPRQRSLLLRYFNPVGAHPSALIGEMPIDTPNNLVPFITQTAAGIRKQLTVFGDDYNTRDGSCIRDYIHVMDIARAHTLALQYMMDTPVEQPTAEVLNLGTGNGVSVLEVIKAFESATGQKLNYRIGPRRPGDVEAIYADNRRAREVLGWEIRYSLEDMMKSAWEWQLRLPEIVTRDAPTAQ